MSGLTRLTCPHCGRNCSTSKLLTEGSKVRCPGCGSVFVYSDPETIPLAEQVEVSPVRLRPPAVRPEIVRNEDRRAASVQTVQVNLPEVRNGNALAIAALVLGILAALICWIPFLGLLALPVGALGMLLGAIGIFLVIVKKRSGLAASVVGAGMSLGAIILSIAITGTSSQAISDAMKPKREPVAQAKPTVALMQEPLSSAHPQGEPTILPPHSPEKAENEWVVAPTPAKLGNIEVRVISARVARVALKGPSGEGQSEKPQLIVTIEVANTSQNRKLEYKTWVGADVSFERVYATLEDNFANNYKRVTFGIFDRPVGRVVSDSIYPGKSLSDVLVFETPLENIQYLDLELPAKNVDASGVFKIRIPAAMINK